MAYVTYANLSLCGISFVSAVTNYFTRKHIKQSYSVDYNTFYTLYSNCTVSATASVISMCLFICFSIFQHHGTLGCYAVTILNPGVLLLQTGFSFCMAILRYV